MLCRVATALTADSDNVVAGSAACGVVRGRFLLNSDDPPMFGTTLSDEYRTAAQAFGLGRAELAALARNAVVASYLDEPGKQAILAEIDAIA